MASDPCRDIAGALGVHVARHMPALTDPGKVGGLRERSTPRVRTHYFHTLQKRVGMETEVTMSTLFYLSSAQMDTIRPFFPRSRGVPRVDDQKILSGIIYVLKFGLQWKDAPKE
ncbi:transposase, partial [uncultured Desulfovibrio sp.]|uniref:transposase n=1 Tax=uncultured Desulfovibrio sp. TaxID=167968 RepID=UPI0034444C70